MPFKRRIDWLSDIVENCDRIARHVDGMTRDDYAADGKTGDAVERCLQRLCEAATRLRHHERTELLGESLDELYPEVPWADVRGMSDILRHGYDRLDADIVWVTIAERLGPLRDAASREVERLSRPDRDGTSAGDPP